VQKILLRPTNQTWHSQILVKILVTLRTLQNLIYVASKINGSHKRF